VFLPLYFALFGLLSEFFIFYHYYKNNPLKRIKMKIINLLVNVFLYILLPLFLLALSVFFYVANSGLFWGAALCFVALLFGGVCELLDI
jgi:hypothetical protein